MFFFISFARSSSSIEPLSKWILGEWDGYKYNGLGLTENQTALFNIEFHNNHGMVEGSFWKNEDFPLSLISQVSDYNIANFEIGFSEENVGEVFYLGKDRKFITKIEPVQEENRTVVKGRIDDNRQFELDIFNKTSAFLYITTVGQIYVDQYFMYKQMYYEPTTGKLKRVLMIFAIGISIQYILSGLLTKIQNAIPKAPTPKPLQQHVPFLEKGKIKNN